MIVVVAPEPGAWIAPTVAALAAIDRVAVWAPWTMAPPWAALPGAAGRFARRRQLDGADGQPGWALAQAAARAWAGDRVDRRYRVAFAERALVDAWAARRLDRLPTPPRAVVACTGAALRTFAVAASRGVTTALIADLPWLRRLHDDLDRAAAALPARAFLRRFRAPRAAIVRQEMERTLASLIAVRGHHAGETCALAGVAPDRIVAVPGADRVVTDRVATDRIVATDRSATDRSATDRVATDRAATADRAASDRSPIATTAPRAIVLAGLATARTGLDAALVARDRHPTLTLRVRIGDGTEPTDILTRAGVEAVSGDPLRDAVAVIAPAWCETYAPELALAAARGIPVIASFAAAGFAPAVLVPPGDGEVLADALTAVRAGTTAATPRPPLRDLAAALG